MIVVDKASIHPRSRLGVHTGEPAPLSAELRVDQHHLGVPELVEALEAEPREPGRLNVSL